MVKPPHNPTVTQAGEEVNCTVEYVDDSYRTISSYAFFVEKDKRKYLVYMNVYSGKYPVYDVLRLYPERFSAALSPNRQGTTNDSTS